MSDSDLIRSIEDLRREIDQLKSISQPFTGGTWTPSFSSTGATFSYATQAGFYRCIGNLCFITSLIILNGLPGGTTSNVLDMTGLPFPQNATTWVRGWLTVSANMLNVGAGKVPLAYIGPSSTAIHFLRFDQTGASWDFVLASMLANAATEVDVSGWYITA